MHSLAETDHQLTLAPWPHFEDDEISAVEDVLRSGKVNYWTGNEGKAFEQEFAHYCGTKHAIALANGTVALELIWRSLGLEAGDEVVTTPRTFIASASSALLSGLTVRFADVDRKSGNLDPESLERALTPKTRAILAVHLGGWPCPMDSICALAEARGIAVIEDCAQAHGASIFDKKVGSFGRASAWSFCQDKILTTLGEGGMVTTDDHDLWDAGWSLKDHGKSYRAVFHDQHPPGFRWLHESFGTNWRMTEVQAAQGRIALGKLDRWVQARLRNAGIWSEVLSTLDTVRVESPPPEVQHAYYRFYAYVAPETLASGWSRDRILSEISDCGVPCFSGTCSEIYLEKAFGSAQHSRLPVARELGETSLCFLVHPTLTESMVLAMAERTAAVLERAKR